MRKQAREAAFFRIYEYLFTAETTDRVDEDLISFNEFSKEDVEFQNTIYEIAIEHLSNYRNETTALLRGFKLDRIHKVDLAIIVCAMAETDAYDTPHPVIINEAVELAKVFSSETSTRFINGLLAQFVKNKSSNNFTV